MIPRTYPTNADGQLIIFEVSPTGLQKWVDYIPVADPGGTPPNSYDDDGAIPTEELVSVTGLQEWVDYIPVDKVTYAAANAWRSDDDGFIPVNIS